ncbi:hypothetical protein L7F22_055791 [Adiantum nelumboides]|nr:hypothetical protein [Adiantum nelumboides]
MDEPNEPDPTDEVDNRELQLLSKIFNAAQKKKLDVKLSEPYIDRRDKRMLDQWLFKTEVYLSNTDLIESKNVALASSLLKGTTFLWWQRRVADGKHTPSWDKFRRAIRKAFEPTNANFHARSSLRRLSQTGSLAMYITEFQRLTLEIETLSPSDKLHSFIDGLEPNLKDDVHKYNPTILDVAIAYVERLGDNRRPTRNFLPGDRSSNSAIVEKAIAKVNNNNNLNSDSKQQRLIQLQGSILKLDNLKADLLHMQAREELMRLAESRIQEDKNFQKSVLQTHEVSADVGEELAPATSKREKVLVTIQNKDGECKSFRKFKDEKFDKLFSSYAELIGVPPQQLVFLFDGQKILEHNTPKDFDMEDEDIIEVNIKK